MNNPSKERKIFKQKEKEYLAKIQEQAGVISKLTTIIVKQSAEKKLNNLANDNIFSKSYAN